MTTEMICVVAGENLSLDPGQNLPAAAERVRAFEASARHLDLKIAADELG